MQQAENKVIEMPSSIQIEHDDKLWIATGRSRYDKKWKNKQLAWSSLLGGDSRPATTPETFAEYMEDEQGRAGQHKGCRRIRRRYAGRRKAVGQDRQRQIDPVLRSGLCAGGLYSDIKLDGAYASACYSTHKYQPEEAEAETSHPALTIRESGRVRGRREDAGIGHRHGLHGSEYIPAVKADVLAIPRRGRAVLFRLYGRAVPGSG